MRLVYYLMLFLLFLFLSYRHATRVAEDVFYDAVKTVSPKWKVTSFLSTSVDSSKSPSSFTHQEHVVLIYLTPEASLLLSTP